MLSQLDGKCHYLLGVTPNGVHRWARGEVRPSGLYRDALERWLTGREK